jgi:hypothetical protein
MNELQEIGVKVEELRERIEQRASTSEGHKARALHAAVQYLKCAADMLREAISRED